MKQEEKTEAALLAIARSGHYVTHQLDDAAAHARDLARKLDAIMVAIAPPSCDVSAEYYRGRVEAFSAACDVIADDIHGIDATGQRFEYDPEPLPLLNPGLEN